MNRGWLKHQLHSSDDLIELVVAELGIGLPKIRPHINTIDR
jgi:hypothetical protein